METTAKLNISSNAGDTINWQLEQSLLKITKGESDHTFEFYFSEHQILAKVKFQKTGRFFVYDSQLDTRAPRDLKAEIIGRINWADEITSKNLMRAIVAWESQRTVDSDRLKDHWINYHELEMHIDPLHGGFRCYIGCTNIDRAMISMSEADKTTRQLPASTKITFFP